MIWPITKCSDQNVWMYWAWTSAYGNISVQYIYIYIYIYIYMCVCVCVSCYSPWTSNQNKWLRNILAKIRQVCLSEATLLNWLKAELICRLREICFMLPQTPLILANVPCVISKFTSMLKNVNAKYLSCMARLRYYLCWIHCFDRGKQKETHMTEQKNSEEKTLFVFC